MIGAIAVRDDARLAGRVLRFHTWPHIKEQSVAEHSWQLLRILMCIWPSVPVHVLAYVIRHDCGELTTGDAPYPVKKDNPVLAAEMNRVEKDGLMLQIEAGFLVDSPELTSEEKWVVKLAEFIEMWEWGLEEQLLGNQFAKLVSLRCLDAVWVRAGREIRHKLNDFQKEIADAATLYVRRRKVTWPV